VTGDSTGLLRAARPRLLAPAVVRAGLVALGLVVAVASGFAVSGESFHAIVLVSAVFAAALILLGIVWPRAIFAALLFNAVIFPALPVVAGRGVNPIDILLPIALFTTWFFGRPEPARFGLDAELEQKRRAVARAGLFYYAVAVASLVALGLGGNVSGALDSFLILTRSFQAAAYFYLVSRLARGRDGVYFVRNTILTALLVAAVINLPLVVFWGLPRAGSVLVLGTPGPRSAAYWTIGNTNAVMTNPNELAAGCLLVWALLLALPLRRPWQGLALGTTIVLLLASTSRSGMLSWLIFVVTLGLRRGHRKLLILPLLGLAAFPLLPDELAGRILRTAVMEEGSFEAYTSIIRVFCWYAAIAIFLDHPILGAGYLGLRHVAHEYNPLGLYLVTAESFYLETASGMGILGLAALAAFGWACVALGRAALRHGAPGSPSYRMGQVASPFLLALAVGNLTGDNLVGLLNGAQLAIFLGVLGRVAVDPDCRAATAPPS
jgi:O-antigen ligase